MKIRDYFEDAERYFREDCYCPNEVYGLDRVSYRLYYPEDEFSPVMRIFEHCGDSTLWLGISKGQFLTVVVLEEGNEEGRPSGTIDLIESLPVNKSNFLAVRDILRDLPLDERHDFDVKDGLDELMEIIDGNLFAISK